MSTLENAFKAYEFVRKNSGRDAVVVCADDHTYSFGLTKPAIAEFHEWNVNQDGRARVSIYGKYLYAVDGFEVYATNKYGLNHPCEYDSYEDDWYEIKKKFHNKNKIGETLWFGIDEKEEARKQALKKKIDHINEQRARTFKGFKTATYGRKQHRDNITQLENSVRRMF